MGLLQNLHVLVYNFEQNLIFSVRQSNNTTNDHHKQLTPRTNRTRSQSQKTARNPSHIVNPIKSVFFFLTCFGLRFLLIILLLLVPISFLIGGGVLVLLIL